VRTCVLDAEKPPELGRECLWPQCLGTGCVNCPRMKATNPPPESLATAGETRDELEDA